MLHPPGRPQPGQGVLTEVAVVFSVATLIIALCYRARHVPIMDQYLSVVAAVVFLYLPAGILWRRGEELESYGFTFAGPGRSLLFAGVCIAVILPLFGLGYWVYVQRICPRLPHWLAACGTAPPALRLPPDLPLRALGQLLVIAMPEEFFFRGYVQGRLRQRYARFPALLLTAAIFALGHVLVSFDVGTLMVFFPGLLFGLLREATSSIVAGTLFHAACNVYIDILHRSIG